MSFYKNKNILVTGGSGFIGSNFLVKLSKLDASLQKKIDNSVEIIENNKKESLKIINEQIQEIIKVTLLKISSIEVSEQEIKESMINIQSKIVR